MAKKLTGKAKCGLENLDALMLPYQAAWVRDRSRIKLVEKSRQIGFSWATAYDLVRQAVLESARLDTWVSSRDELQARLFLEDCKKFGDILEIAASALGEGIYKDDGGKPYTSFDLKFRSGATIHSMSSNPDAQAGKRGTRVLDEFALHPDPVKLYAIAYPGITWGGQMAIISTHRGADNFFNKLVQEAKFNGNPKKISLHRVTLEDALNQGFLAKLQSKLAEGDPRLDMDEQEYFDDVKSKCAAEAQEDLDFYPCYELIRIRRARQPRDWKSRWTAAGGKLYGGKMIAEVNDPVWAKISRFGNPYPPFDFNSGMGLRDVSRGEAVKCGAINEDHFAEPEDIPSINESLESEISGASDELKAEISDKMKGFAEWRGDKLVFTDPNGTKPYSSKEIVDVINKPLPENFYGDGKSPYHQRDALVEWTKDSDYIKNHTTSDKAYHFGRLLKRIEPMKADEKLYRGMSWNAKYPNQKAAYDGFMEQVEEGYFERSTFESYSTNAAMVKDKYMDKPTKVFITVVRHSNAKYIGEVVKRYFERNADEQEVLFSRGGRMKILKKEIRGDTLYLTVEESQ